MFDQSSVRALKLDFSRASIDIVLHVAVVAWHWIPFLLLGCSAPEALVESYCFISLVCHWWQNNNNLRAKSCLLLWFSLSRSTIHGRIDQVNQLLELDYQKRGGARYTALDKWTNQLNTLNQAIVSKLTWWLVYDTNGMLQIHLNYVSALVGFFPIMPSSRRSLRPRESFPVSFVRRFWSGKLLTLCFLIDWSSLLCATHKRFRWSNPNAQEENVHSLVLYTVHC